MECFLEFECDCYIKINFSEYFYVNKIILKKKLNNIYYFLKSNKGIEKRIHKKDDGYYFLLDKKTKVNLPNIFMYMLKG